ncbi:MAG: transcription termination/antitermination protein NusG [Microbacteriaceae bacterium]|nr:transcription termination/antitermination protein NusG [Microbacteriaceae bacterium]MCI1206846.1 transcription termination/antitermination protein NusG [Microbacteriaceae bacterium]
MSADSERREQMSETGSEEELQETAPAVETGDAATAVPEDGAPAEAVPAEEAVDPLDAFKKDLRKRPGKWYVLHSYSGYEKSVKHAIENRRENQPGGEDVFEVQVPQEEVLEVRNGQRKLVRRVRIPGYVMVRMRLNEDSWSLVRHTPGVTGFVGVNEESHMPTPLRLREAFDMLKTTVEQEQKAAAVAAVPKGSGSGAKTAPAPIPTDIDFEIGETITIKEGSFTGLPGTISEIKPESGKLTVLVSLFERETPVELSFDQVVKL